MLCTTAQSTAGPSRPPAVPPKSLAPKRLKLDPGTSPEVVVCYCLLHACMHASTLYPSISIKRSPKRLSANSSGERRRIKTKLYQRSGAMPDLQLRGATCANKLPPMSARRKTFNRPSAILDLQRKYMVSRLPEV